MREDGIVKEKGKEGREEETVSPSFGELEQMGKTEVVAHQ